MGEREVDVGSLKMRYGRKLLSETTPFQLVITEHYKF